MAFEYNGQTWIVSPTTRDHNSVFHSIFGTQNTDNGLHTENIAHVRRLNWLNFLTFYEERSLPTALKEALSTLFQKHDWSIEDNNDFKEYLKLASEERQVFPEELVILAALENIRIVFFHNEPEFPQIVEPITEILDEYPFVSSSSIETVVIALIGDSYTKLSSQNTSEGIRYEKSSVVPFAGMWYQINLLTVILLNALQNYKTFRLSTEDARAHYFDDLVLEWGPQRYAFLLQAKNRHRRKAVTGTEFFQHRMNGFHLPKYFFSYLKVRHNYNISSVVLCTNTEIRFDIFKGCFTTRNLAGDDPLYFEGMSSVSYSFSNEILPLFLEKFKLHADECRGDPDLVTEDNVLTFIRHFQIISSYPGSIDIEKVIEDKLVSMGISEKFESTNSARHLNKKILEWFDSRNGVYFTPLYGKTIFSEIRSKQSLGKLHRLGLELKPYKLHLALRKKITHVVPLGDQTLSLLKVFKFLEEEEDSTLFLSTRESGFNQKMMVEAFEARCFKYLVIYKSEPVQNPYEVCEMVVKSLKKFEDKKVVLISQKQDDMAKLLRDHDHTMFETLCDDVTFTDFTEASQEELLEKAVLFYEASL